MSAAPSAPFSTRSVTQGFQLLLELLRMELLALTTILLFRLMANFTTSRMVSCLP
jgi:hypothetical protein